MNLLNKIHFEKNTETQAKQSCKNEKRTNKTDKTQKKKNRMIILKKKQLLAFSLIALVAVAGYLNKSFRYDLVDPEVAEVYSQASKKLGEAQMVNATQSEDKNAEYQTENAASDNGYFSSARTERETRRDESIETLLQLINSDSADKEAKENAQAQVHELTTFTEQETQMENMIKAKGYSDTVVFMGKNLISIAVCSQGLNEVDAAVINDIAASVTGYGADKINIVEVGE